MKTWCGDQSKSDLSLDNCREYLELGVLCLNDTFLRQRLLHWIIKCGCGNFHGCLRWEENNFTQSRSPYLWEASLKWVADSSVKQKKKKKRIDTNVCEDSLGAICYNMWLDDKDGILSWCCVIDRTASFVVSAVDVSIIKNRSYGNLHLHYMCMVLNQKQSSAFWGTVKCNISSSLFTYISAVSCLSFPFQKWCNFTRLYGKIKLIKLCLSFIDHIKYQPFSV